MEGDGRAPPLRHRLLARPLLRWGGPASTFFKVSKESRASALAHFGLRKSSVRVAPSTQALKKHFASTSHTRTRRSAAHLATLSVRD
ncbi:hypothetical protein MRX96_005302 [Rhipicephalus microplus]